MLLQPYSVFFVVYSLIVIQGYCVGEFQPTPCSTRSDCPNQHTPSNAIYCCHEYGCCTKQGYVLVAMMRGGVVGQCAKDVDVHYNSCFKNIVYCYNLYVPSDTVEQSNCIRRACLQPDDTTCCLGDGLQHTNCSFQARLLLGQKQDEVVCMPRSCAESRQVENFTRIYNNLACAVIYGTNTCAIQKATLSCDGGYDVVCADPYTKCTGYYKNSTYAGKAICNNTASNASMSIPPSTMKVTSRIPVTNRSMSTPIATLMPTTTGPRPTNAIVTSTSSVPTTASATVSTAHLTPTQIKIVTTVMITSGNSSVPTRTTSSNPTPTHQTSPNSRLSNVTTGSISMPSTAINNTGGVSPTKPSSSNATTPPHLAPVTSSKPAAATSAAPPTSHSPTASPTASATATASYISQTSEGIVTPGKVQTASTAHTVSNAIGIHTSRVSSNTGVWTSSLAGGETSSSRNLILIGASTGGVSVVACVVAIVAVRKCRKYRRAARTLSSRYLVMEDKELLPEHLDDTQMS